MPKTFHSEVIEQFRILKKHVLEKVKSILHGKIVRQIWGKKWLNYCFVFGSGVSLHQAHGHAKQRVYTSWVASKYPKWQTSKSILDGKKIVKV